MKLWREAGLLPAHVRRQLQKTQRLPQPSVFCLHVLGALLSAEDIRASRVSDMPENPTITSHPHPHISAQVSSSMLPPYTAEWGWITKYQLGRHLPSGSHLCL